MIEKLMAWLRKDPAYAEPNPLVRETLRTGRREWPTGDGGTLRLLTPDSELRMTPAERWALRNAENRAAGCPCGREATVCTVSAVMAAHGARVEQWTCAEHQGHAGVQWMEHNGVRTNVVFTYEHPRPCPLGDDRGSGGKIGQPPSRFYCMHRTHEEAT